jgi:hypothetical protein
MRSLRCPVCRADNSEPPACRRCKADLSALFTLEGHRAFLMAEARAQAHEGSWQNFLASVRRADELRRDQESRRLLAVGLLMARDFCAALRQVGPPAGRS